MKQGCLFLIAVMAAAFGAYYKLIASTELSDKWWIPVLLALGAGLTAGNLQGIYLALKQKHASKRQRSEWRDGDLVMVSGRVQTLRSPLTAPFSGAPVAIIEYTIKRQGRDVDSPAIDQFNGFMMTTCSVVTAQGSVNLAGFPLLAKVPTDIYADEASFQRAAEFLQKTTFKLKPANPITLLQEFSKVLSQEEGELQAHFAAAGAPTYSAPTSTPQTGPEGESLPAPDLSPLVATLQNEGAILEEIAVRNGAEVTVCGKYLASHQAIDIGSGLSNLSHWLQLGDLSHVTAKALRQAFIGTVVFGAGFAAGNYFLLKTIGLLK